MSWIVLLVALLLIVIFFLLGYIRGAFEPKPGPSRETVERVEEILKRPVGVALRELKGLVKRVRMEDKPYVYYHIAELYLRNDQHRKALRLLRSIIVSPYLGEELRKKVILRIGEIYLYLNRPEEAIQFLQEHKLQDDKYFYLLAKAYERKGEYRKALREYVRIFSSVENEQLINTYARLAIESARRGELETARNLISQGARHGEMPLLDAARGILAYYEGDKERAAQFLTQALQSDDTFYVYVRDELRDAYYELGQYDKFLEFLKRLNNAIARIDYIRILVNMGERDRARQFMYENSDTLFSSLGLIARLYMIFPEKELVDKLVELSLDSPIYRCVACGYETSNFHIECPSCFRIGSLRLKTSAASRGETIPSPIISDSPEYS